MSDFVEGVALPAYREWLRLRALRAVVEWNTGRKISPESATRAPLLLELIERRRASMEELGRDTAEAVRFRQGLVDRSLRSIGDRDAVRRQTGGNAPELVQGLLDRIGELWDRIEELEAWRRSLEVSMKPIGPRLIGFSDSGDCPLCGHVGGHASGCAGAYGGDGK